MKWQNEKLKKVATIIKGKKPSLVTDSLTENCNIPYVTIEAFESGQAKQWGMNSGTEIITRKGELLIVWDGSRFGLVGKSIGGILGSTLAVIRPKDYVETNYLYYLLKSKYEVLRTVKRGSGIPHLDGQHLNNLLVPVPPLSEQRRIVEILDQADALRKKRAGADDKAARILPALFYKMFGDPATNPMGWPVVLLENVILNTRNGLYKPTEFYGSGIRILKMFNIQNGELDLTRIDLIKVTDDEYEAYRLVPGDILINRVNTPELVGKCAVITEDVGKAVFESKNIRIKVRTDFVTPEFIAAYLNNPFGHGTLSSGVKHAIGMATINNSDIRRIQIFIPPLELQTKWTNVVRGMQALRKMKSITSEKLDSLFQNLLHRVFSGDLTAKWREAHLEELLVEMENQAKELL